MLCWTVPRPFRICTPHSHRPREAQNSSKLHLKFHFLPHTKYTASTHTVQGNNTHSKNHMIYMNTTDMRIIQV